MISCAFLQSTYYLHCNKLYRTVHVNQDNTAMSASKRDILVKKALQVFYRNGFHATGMDMLVTETGVSKTSMYKHFRTKDDLILASLRLRDELFRNWLMRRMEELATTPREQLLAMFDALGEWFDQEDFNSCMFIKAASEYPDPDHPVRASAAEHKRLIKHYLVELGEKAGVAEPAQLARRFLLLKEGAIVTAHIQGSAGVAADARQAAQLILTDACQD